MSDECIYTKVNIDTIKEVQKEYNLHSNNIMNILSNVLTEVNELDDIFYTKTSLEYKERVTKCLNKIIDDFDNKKRYFDSQFSNITNIYTELCDEIKSSVGKNKMEV